MHNRTELSHVYFIALESDGVCVLSERKVTTDLCFLMFFCGKIFSQLDCCLIPPTTSN